MCIHCGTCHSVCPTNAIQWDETKQAPFVIQDKCIDCGLCLRVCPSVDIWDYYKPIYSSEIKYLVGPVRKVLLAWSSDRELRYTSSSGGFVTQFLVDLMELGIIDGAIVTVPHRKYPYLAEGIIAESKEEVLRAKGSKYTISSPGLLLQELKHKKGKFAVVGLPCHIMSFKKAETIYPSLKGKIVIYIGLFCGHIAYPELYELIISKEHKKDKNMANRNKIKNIEYRGRGWPGSLKITFDNELSLKLPHDYWVSTYFSSMLFTPKRCILCPDSTAELADISVGDPWIKTVRAQEKLGKSLIIIRTKRGEKLLDKAVYNGNIQLSAISNDSIFATLIMSQKTNITFKKLKPTSRFHFIKKYAGKLDRRVEHNFDTVERGTMLFISFISFLVLSMAKTLIEKKLRNKIPKVFIRLYSFIVFISQLYSPTKIKKILGEKMENGSQYKL